MHSVKGVSSVIILWLSLWIHGYAQDETQTVTITPTKDGTLYAEDGFGDINRGNGKGEALVIGSPSQGFFRRALLAFDVRDQVPAGSVVTSARLRLTVVNLFAQPFVQVFRIQSDWAEGQSVASENPQFGVIAETGDATWNFPFYDVDAEEGTLVRWPQPGGDFSFMRPLFQDVGTVDSENVMTIESDLLTADVQTMIDQPGRHQGWILLGDESGLAFDLQLYNSVDSEDETVRPMLEIEYTAKSDFEKVAVNYGTLNTVAGLGEEDGRGNDWRERFEGGRALTAELSRPSTAQMDWEGNIYIADTYAHAIRKVSPDGVITTVAGTGTAGYNGDGLGTEVQLTLPNGLDILRDGSVYILDKDNDRIRKLHTDGQLTTVFHDPDLETGRGLWVSGDENTIYYASAKSLKKWTRTDPPTEPVIVSDGYLRLANIDVDRRTGDILVADLDVGRIYRVDAETGERMPIAGGGRKKVSGSLASEIDLEEVRGLAVSDHGGYFVTAESGGDVWYIDTSGIAHVVVPGSGRGFVSLGEGLTLADIINEGTNKIGQPYAITIAPNGQLVLTLNETGVVRVIDKAPPPTLQSVGRTSDGNFTMTWRTVMGTSYVIETLDEFNQWQLFGELGSNGSSLSFTASDTGEQSKQIFRVRLYYP